MTLKKFLSALMNNNLGINVFSNNHGFLFEIETRKDWLKYRDTKVVGFMFDNMHDALNIIVED